MAAAPMKTRGGVVMARPLRNRDQMHVIGHQDVGAYETAVCFACLGEPIVIALIILRREEDILAVVAALDDMHWVAGRAETWSSGHVASKLLLTEPSIMLEAPRGNSWLRHRSCAKQVTTSVC